MFYGREKELKEIQTYASGGGIKCILILGNAGIGKTTLVFREFYGKTGFVDIDLSVTTSFGYILGDIANALISYLKSNGIKYRDIEKRLKEPTTVTRGRNLIAKLFGVGAQTNYQETTNPNLQFEEKKIIEIAFSRIKKKSVEPIIALDGTDFIKDCGIQELENMCARLKRLLPSPSVMILINRDRDEKFSKAYYDFDSQTSSLFSDILKITHLWNPGEGNLIELLTPRFKRGSPKEKYVFPISIQGCNWIDILSGGNIRDCLKSTKMLLRLGQKEESRIPLSEEFCLKHLKSIYDNYDLGDDRNVSILEYIDKKPSSASNQEFVNSLGVSRSTISRRMKRLERLNLLVGITINKKPGTIEYRTTQRYKKLSEWI